jgi:hypothetical protein
VSPGEQSIYADGELILFRGLIKAGVYLQFGPGLLDFEFELHVFRAISLKLAVHAEFPVPRLPPLNPQAYINSGAVANGDASGMVNLDPFKDFISSFDISKFKFSISASIDSQLIRELFGSIVEDCLPDMQGIVDVAKAAYDVAKVRQTTLDRVASCSAALLQLLL